VKEHVVCVISIKCVVYDFVMVRYMDDEYEKSYECLSVLSERR